MRNESSLTPKSALCALFAAVLVASMAFIAPQTATAEEPYEPMKDFKINEANPLTVDLSYVSIDTPEGGYFIRTSTSTNAAYSVVLSVGDSTIAKISTDGESVIPLKVGTTTLTATATEIADQDNTATDTITLIVTDDVATHPSPFNTDGTLLPHSISSDGVMTFSDSRVGSWYRLALDVDDDVTSEGCAGGGSNWAMTIDSSMLDRNDPGYSSDGTAGPFYIRGDNGGAESHLVFDIPDTKAVKFSLEPASAGTIRLNGPQGNRGIVHIQLNAPAILKVTTSDSTIVTNSSGASIAHKPSDGSNDALWSSLSFISNELTGNAAKQATEAVKTQIDGVQNLLVLDLHLKNIDNSPFAIPEGDKVTVTLPIPAGWTTEGLLVLHIADNGAVTDMNATVDANARTISFETTHFSTFALASVDSTPAPIPTDPTKDVKRTNLIPATGDPLSSLVVAVCFAGLAAVALGLVSFRMKRD